MTRIAPLTLLLLLLSGCSSVSPGPPRRPNVVFILADDFGIMDARGYATHFGELPADSLFYETPNLDRLIATGSSFSQAYATQLCSPTRAGLLTGKWAPRLGFMTAMPVRETYFNQDLPVPAGYYPHDVLDHRDNILIERAWDNATSNSALPLEALSLAEALTEHESAFIGKWHLGGFMAPGYQPADHGFRPLAWFDGGGSTYRNWRPVWARTPGGDPGPETGEDYLTDDLTAQAVNYLEERSKSPEQPFFLYFNHFAVHSPYQGKPAEVDHFSGKPTRGNNGHADPVYASMVQSLDRSVGAIVEKLRTCGLARNTLLIFMSDNGGIDRKITPRGDGTDNQPFLGGKACLTEGGIRVPLIVRLPGHAGGDWIDTPVDYTDLFPTILAATGYDADSVIVSEDLDGRSLLPLLGGTGSYDKTDRYWHYPFNVIYNSPYDGLPLTPHSAIRSGDHKLIFDWYGRLHLYDIVADPYERNDLAESDPELRERLFTQLKDWLDKNVAPRYLPVRNPAYRPSDEARAVPFVNLLK